MKAIILLPYLFLLGCANPAADIKSEPQKIKKSSSSTESINTYPMGYSKTKFEVELEQQKNRVDARSQNYDSYGASLSSLRDERDRQEEANRKKKKEQSEASERKIQSLNDEYDLLKAKSNYKKLSSEEEREIKNRMKEIEIDRNRERFNRPGESSGNSRSWEWEWSQ